MIILGDYHTHTIYSSGKHKSKHAKGTIFENALSAKQKGLKEIGISEHGFSHMLYGLQRNNLESIRKEIKEAEEQLGIRILLGIEANIISPRGEIDLTADEIKLFDYVILGFHSFAKPKKFKDVFTFFLPNILGFRRKKDFERNTKALCNAIENNNITIISHPGVNFPVDFERICDAANKTQTLLEVNGKRIAYSEKDVETIVRKRTKLIINSDAHSPLSVGEVNFPTNFVFSNNIPTDLVVNLNSLPNFKKGNK